MANFSNIYKAVSNALVKVVQTLTLDKPAFPQMFNPMALPPQEPLAIQALPKLLSRSALSRVLLPLSQKPG